MRSALLIFLFTFSQLSFGKILAPHPKVSIKKLRTDVRKQKTVVSKLSKEITSLERSLGKGNKRYIRVIKNRKLIEEKIFKSKVQIKENEKGLKDHHQQVKRVLTSAVLNSLKENQKPAEMLGQKILLKSLKNKIIVLENDIQMNKDLISSLNDLEKRFNHYQFVEAELSNLLNEMENKKKVAASKYIREKKKRDKLQRRYDASKILKKAKRKIKESPTLVSLRFKAPIKEFTGLEYRKKGMTFKFEGRRPVYPTLDGKVDYVGTLSNYGNVLMINHGDDTRSVIFGRFSAKVKKGQAVKVGQIIGYTDDSSSNGITSGKIYFEVRKRDKAQNTIRLMNKQWLAKNNLTPSRT